VGKKKHIERGVCGREHIKLLSISAAENTHNNHSTNRTHIYGSLCHPRNSISHHSDFISKISDLFLQVIKPELREIKSELTLFIYKGVVHFCKVIPYSSSGVV